MTKDNDTPTQEGFDLQDIYRRNVLKGIGTGVGLGVVGTSFAGTASALGFDEQVEINIKPGSDPNAINCKKQGGTPVAVLSTDNFDATTVDPSSLRFGKPRVVAEGGGAGLQHEGGHLEDVDADGDTDFVGHFTTRDTGFTADDTEGWLVGETTDGRRIVGRDSVKIVGRCPEEEEGLPEVGLGSTVEQTTDDVPEPPPDPDPVDPPEEKFFEGYEELKEKAETGDVLQPPEDTIQKSGVPSAPSPPEGSGGDEDDGVVQSTDGRSEFIGIGEGFSAWEKSEVRTAPPDENLAVGPSKVVAAVNLRWGIFDKSGNREFQVQLEDWFAPVLDENDGIPFDPKALYDHHEDRFVLMSVVKNGEDEQASWLVAVSDDDNPLGTWWLTKIPHDVEGEWPDYPSLGVDEHGIYLTAKVYEFDGGFQQAKIVTIDKMPLYNGNSFTYWWFNDVRRPGGSRAFVIQPTHDMPATSSGGPQWLVDSRASGGDKLTLFELRNPTSSPRLFSYNIDVPQYGVPPNAEQPNPIATLDTLDARLMNAVYENGSVWTAHSINYDWDDDGDASALLRWYELDTGSKSLSQVRGWGRPNGDYFFPTVASDGNSTMITYNESGPDTPVRIEVAGRTPDHTQSSLEDVALIKYGESPAPGGRWGDYTGIVVNPGIEGDNYYTIVQYANDEDTPNDWETWIGPAEFEEELE